MRLGDIYWSELDPVRGHEQASTRPIVILSVDACTASRSPRIAVVPLPRALVNNPLHIELKPGETSLADSSVALVVHVRFVDGIRLAANPVGQGSPAARAMIRKNLARVFGLLA